MAAPLSAARRPGTRLLVEYGGDPEWAHERVILWPCAGDQTAVLSCILLTPDGILGEEAFADFARCEAFVAEYPAWVDTLNLRQFDLPMEVDDFKHHMNLARREVRRVLGGRNPGPVPSEFVDSAGQAYPISRLGILRAGRDALVGHRPVVARGGAGSPFRRVRKKAPVPLPDQEAVAPNGAPGAGVGDIEVPAEPPPLAPPAVSPPGPEPKRAASRPPGAVDALGAGDVDTPRNAALGFAPTHGKMLGAGESAEIADCAWMVICPTPTRSAIGKTVTPGEGSFISSAETGRFGFHLDPSCRAVCSDQACATLFDSTRGSKDSWTRPSR